VALPILKGFAMAKAAALAVLNAPLDVIDSSTELYFCEGQPTSRADAITRAAAPAVTMAAGDFAISNQGTGRRLTVAAKSTTANASRAVDHVALCSGTELLYVTTCASVNATSGASISSGAFTIDMPQVV
jgi:hypothetical protein